MKTLPAVIASAASLVLLAGCGGGGDQAIGDTATVALKGKDVAVAVTKVEKGSADELAAYYEKSGVSNGADIIGGKTPYYVHYTFADSGGADLGGAELGEMSGVDEDGTALQGASGLTAGEGGESFGPCTELSTAPDDFDSKGASFETCSVALADSGAEVTGGNYIPDDVSKAVTWKQ